MYKRLILKALRRIFLRLRADHFYPFTQGHLISDAAVQNQRVAMNHRSGGLVFPYENCKEMKRW